MAERIHPSDPKATTAPTPEPDQTQPPPPSSSQTRDYVIQVPRDQVFRDPPPENQRLAERKAMRRNNSRRRRSCCCCCLGLLLLLIIALGVTAGILYLIFRPKAPNYTVDSLSIRGLNVSSPSFNSGSLSPTIDAIITADNPNSKIGFYYRDGSSINVYFSGSIQPRLSSGKWPAFYHGKSNETIVSVALKGEEVFLTEVVENEMRAAERAERVPLNFNVNIPVKIKFGLLKLWKMTVKIRCSVVVNELSPEAKIVSNDCGRDFDIIDN